MLHVLIRTPDQDTMDCSGAKQTLALLEEFEGGSRAPDQTDYAVTEIADAHARGDFDL